MTGSIWSGPFWKATAERAIKTLAQTAAATAGVGVGLLDIGWVDVASLSGAAAFLSVLTSIGSAAVTDGSPSLADEVIAPDPGLFEDIEPAVEAAATEPDDYVGRHRQEG